MKKGNFKLIYIGGQTQVRCPDPLTSKIYEYINNWMLKSFDSESEEVEKIHCSVKRVLIPGGLASRMVTCPNPIIENVRALINNWKLNGGTNNG